MLILFRHVAQKQLRNVSQLKGKGYNMIHTSFKEIYLENQLLQYDVTRPLHNASLLVLIGLTKTCN